MKNSLFTDFVPMYVDICMYLYFNFSEVQKF